MYNKYLSGKILVQLVLIFKISNTVSMPNLLLPLISCALFFKICPLQFSGLVNPKTVKIKLHFTLTPVVLYKAGNSHMYCHIFSWKMT